MTETEFPGSIERNVPLAPMTTLGVGGPARFLVRATSVDGVAAGVLWARREGLPIFVLAGGSNVVISDSGFPGLVIRMELRGIATAREGSLVRVTAASGERWDELVARAVAEGWGGIECLSGIPGAVGSTPIQNVGAYGQEVSETIERVEALDRTSVSVVRFTADECRFGYRTSRFKREDRGRYVILSVTYALRAGGAPAIRYPELQGWLEDRGTATADLAAVREAVLAIRRRKGMVLDPDDPDTRSDGSFFTNPVISKEAFESFLPLARRRAGEVRIPAFDAPGGAVKLSAAWLIEQAGFRKGYGEGSVGISSKHTLAIVNRGGGSAAEVLSLVREIQGRVREVFGIELEPEPDFVGF